MSKFAAFIGTRDLGSLPTEWVELYINAAKAAAQHGYTVVTGAAVGADQKAATVALECGGIVRLVLPWLLYEKKWVQYVLQAYPDKVEVVVYDPVLYSEWLVSVYKYHPAANNLTQGVMRLHARNFGIVENAVSVVALPNTQVDTNGNRILGGTGQGMRCAEALGIKLFDLTTEEGRQDMETRLSK